MAKETKVETTPPAVTPPKTDPITAPPSAKSAPYKPKPRDPDAPSTMQELVDSIGDEVEPGKGENKKPTDTDARKGPAFVTHNDTNNLTEGPVRLPKQSKKDKEAAAAKLKEEADAKAAEEQAEADRLAAEELAKNPPKEETAEEKATREAAAAAATRDADIEEVLTTAEHADVKPATRESFKKLSTELRAARDARDAAVKEKADLEKRLTEAKPITPEVEKELTELRNRVAEYDVQELPEIKTTYDEPLLGHAKFIMESLQKPEVISILEAAGVNKEGIDAIKAGTLPLNRSTVKFAFQTIKAGSKGNVALDDLADEINDRSKQAERLAAEKETKVKGLRETIGATKAKKAEDFKKAQEADKKAVTDFVVAEVNKRPWAKMEIIADTDDAPTKARKQANNDYLTGLLKDFNLRLQVKSGTDLAKLAVDAVEAQHLRKEVEKKEARIRQLEDDLAKYTSKRSTPPNNPAPVRPAAPPAKPKVEAPAAGRSSIHGRMSYLDDAMNEVESSLR